MKGYELTDAYPLNALLHTVFTIEIKKEIFYINIPINEYTIKRHNNLATEYYFEIILVSGDSTRLNTLRVESEKSILYNFKSDYSETCTLNIQIPRNKPWMMWLKAACLEGKEAAKHPKHYGMRIVGAG